MRTITLVECEPGHSSEQDRPSDARESVSAASETPSKSASVIRQCPTCERCRDCGYTHIGMQCPAPDPDFDGTCLCDPLAEVPEHLGDVDGSDVALLEKTANLG
jgi:hypothetical protein